MQALKALVIFMGILIAIGVTVVGVTVYRRATDMVATDKVTGDKATQDKAASSGAADTGLAARDGSSAAISLKDAAPASFGARELGLPVGSEIVTVQTVALQQGVEQILVHARLPDGGASVLVLDPRRGNVVGEWRVRGARDSNAPAQP